MIGIERRDELDNDLKSKIFQRLGEKFIKEKKNKLANRKIKNRVQNTKEITEQC